jgi:hypothetical protein
MQKLSIEIWLVHETRLDYFALFRMDDLPKPNGNGRVSASTPGSVPKLAIATHAPACKRGFALPRLVCGSVALNRPITFSVKFGPETFNIAAFPPLPFPVGQILPSQGIVADRAYNGMSLADALLGKAVLQSIKVDPQSPNRQVALFQNGQKLVTRISDRATETPSDANFVSSELYQQEFRSSTQIYFNRVENTIAYHQVSSKPPLIEADQVTAIYLSPQDPDYFKAKDRPVTLYRYQLQFLPR